MMPTMMITTGGATPIAIFAAVLKALLPPPDAGDDEADLKEDAVALGGAVVLGEVLAEDVHSKAKPNKCAEPTQYPKGCSAGAFVALNVHSGSP